MERIHGSESGTNALSQNYPPVEKLMYLHYTDIIAGYVNVNQASMDNMVFIFTYF